MASCVYRDCSKNVGVSQREKKRFNVFGLWLKVEHEGLPFLVHFGRGSTEQDLVK